MRLTRLMAMVRNIPEYCHGSTRETYQVGKQSQRRTTTPGYFFDQAEVPSENPMMARPKYLSGDSQRVCRGKDVETSCAEADDGMLPGSVVRVPLPSGSAGRAGQASTAPLAFRW